MEGLDRGVALTDNDEREVQTVIKKRKYVSVVVQVLICLGIAGVIAYVARPTVPPDRERLKLHQQIGPFTYIDNQAAVVLQGIVDSAEIPLTVKLCKTLAGRKISIATETPRTMEAILKEVGEKLGCELRLFSGHQPPFQPMLLLCPTGTSGEQDLVSVETKRG